MVPTLNSKIVLLLTVYLGLKVGGTMKRLAANIVTSHKGIITDCHSFVEAAESSSKLKVLHVTSADIKEKLFWCELNVLMKNAVPLPGIFSAHHLEYIGGIAMQSA